MSQLTLDFSTEEKAELGKAARQDGQTEQEFIKAAIAEYLASLPPPSHMVSEKPVAVYHLATEQTGRKVLSPEEAKLRRAEAKRRMPGFGLLKNKLQVDGVPVSDGVEYQNRMRGAW